MAPLSSVDSTVTSALPVKGAGIPVGRRVRRLSSAKAQGPQPVASSSSIKQLTEMGFAEDQARQALAECVWDVNKALDLLMERAAAAPPSASAAATVAEAVSIGTSASDDDEDSADKAAIARKFSDFSTTASTDSSPRSLGQTEERAAKTALLPADAASSDDEPLIPPRAAVEVTAVDEVVKPAPAQPEPVSAAVSAESEFIRRLRLSSTDSIADTPKVASQSQKRILRASSAWIGQLTVQEGDFVRAWKETETNGWLYVETLAKEVEAGWIPAYALAPLPDTQRWVNVKKSMQALHETQLSVVEDSMLKVTVETLTTEGWVYAETPDDAQAGWVPAYCFNLHEE